LAIVWYILGPLYILLLRAAVAAMMACSCQMDRSVSLDPDIAELSGLLQSPKWLH